MAGLFPSIANSQNVDANGTPLANAQLTVYNGGTLAQSTVYQDINLQLPGQNPMYADITGRLPLFYVADGTYRVRLFDKNGILIYDYLQIASIGASTSGGGGSTVDPTTIFQTGDVIWAEIQGTRTGWVRDNGNTIGSATSGASERANNDCQALFLWLWNNLPDTMCPVVGGRGASAAADWAANKQITTPDKRGNTIGGLTAMGGAGSGRYNGVPLVIGSSGDTPGGILGENTHTLLVAEIPSHTHSGTTGVENSVHTHNLVLQNSGQQAQIVGGGGIPNVAQIQGATTTTGESANHTHNFTTDNGTGGGQVHNNVQRVTLGTFFRKL